jgi:hypothetical protein
MLSRKFDYMSSAPPSMGSTEPVKATVFPFKFMLSPM